MTSRLRRMLLINTKTSGTVCSGAISEIDPRGGAAITGKNGVGKTTALQLVPLFFGHSPNQIAQAGGTREPMLRFVLPYPQCAVAFEYQRGTADEDIRLVVMRRQSTSDAPEYRFFEGPFRKELFIQNLPDGGGSVFLEDDGTVAVAAQLGMVPSQKLHAAGFRAVILNLGSTNKDSEAVRNLARRFSFSQKRLTHMDRLVASVVKEHVDFRDFTAVAVTMVFDQMGGLSASSPANQRLHVQQGKEQIERWLRNRDACERSFKVKGDVEVVYELLKNHRQQVLRLREHRGDVRQLSRLISAYLAEKERDSKALDVSYQEDVELREAKRIKLDGVASGSGAEYSRVRALFDTERDRKEFFEDHDAKHWAAEVGRLPLLRDEQRQTEGKIRTLRSAAEGISRHYEAEIATLQHQGAAAKLKMIEGKTVHDTNYQSEQAALTDQEVQAKEALNARYSQTLEMQTTVVSDLDVAVGEARAAVSGPVIGSGFLQRQHDAQAALNEHNDALLALQEQFASAQSGRADATAVFKQAESEVLLCRNVLTEAQAGLREAKALLNPPQGTLHAALVNAADDHWKTSLARVIDRDLLNRTDLNPVHAPEAAGGVFGWLLTVDHIGSPAWTNQVTLREEVEQSSSRAIGAQFELDTALQALEKASTAHEIATKRFDEMSATQGVLQGKSAALRLDMKNCDDAVRMARADALSIAQKHLAQVQGQANSAKQQFQKLAKTQEKDLSDLAVEFRTARDQALGRRTSAYAVIDKQVEEYEAKQKERLSILAKERDTKLTDEGVDVKRLNALIGELKKLTELINDISERMPLADQWQKWLQNNGPARLADLAVKTSDLEAMKDADKRALDAHNTLIDKAATAYRTARFNMDRVIGGLKTQASTLELSDADLVDYDPLPGSRVTLDLAAEELVGRSTALKSQLAAIVKDINTKYLRVDHELCAKESAVKDFIASAMDDLGIEATTVERADRLIKAYDRIGREVLDKVNTELSTILTNIGQFRSRIQTFESEVRSFNNKLQKGLDGVVLGFDRLKDFKISVVTDFDKLDFMGKLKSLDDVVRYHREQNRATYTVEVPPASSAYALKDFMGVLGNGTLEIDLGQHITLSGSVNDDGNIKVFRRESELESLSSTGLTAIAMITLLSGMLNVIRGKDDIYIPWVTDEVGRFDSGNFQHLMQMLYENRIDVVTASPALTPAAYEHFAHRYLFGAHGSIAVYRDARRHTARQDAAMTTAEVST